jgi:hypothetical protein
LETGHEICFFFFKSKAEIQQPNMKNTIEKRHELGTGRGMQVSMAYPLWAAFSQSTSATEFGKEAVQKNTESPTLHPCN